VGFKINWDAVVDQRKKLIGIGLVARDHLGGVCGVMFSTVAYILDSTFAEALAARKGVELAWRLGIRPFTQEGDSMVIVEDLKKSDISSSVYGGVVCDIISHLSDFELLNFSFVRRGGNSVAHEVAKIDVSMSLHQLWIDYFPSSFPGCIQNDYCNLAI